jgi:2-polyprenyl-3-methyl-5-hydroxy-6-metoxy-1,4-benzoquinol methylase
MSQPTAESLERIRQQYDKVPYPRNPIEQSPKYAYDELWLNSLVTPFYLKHQQVIDTTDKLILDAGCGTGMTSLVLAEANPGARIIGVDLSGESVALAQQRLQFHGFENVEFHALSVTDLSQLGLKFDYISCDEVLYLLPDIISPLKVMQSVLKPEGIIRTNLHSHFQRTHYYRAQKLFRFMGCMDDVPGDLEIDTVIETMMALKDAVALKRETWNPKAAQEPDHLRQNVTLNYLLQGDQGFTIPELFAALRAADLEFLSMIKWAEWELLRLFQDPENLPVVWQMSLPELSIEEQLHVFELLHPVHRLLDFWCTHPLAASPPLLVSEWTQDDWQNAHVCLHPVLQSAPIQTALIHALRQQQPFELTAYLPQPNRAPIILDHLQAACLFPLWENSKTVDELVDRWLKLQPIHAVTLEPLSKQQALAQVIKILQPLEIHLYVLLARST